MTSHHTHNDLHSEHGGAAGEHPGRAQNPVIKVRDIAWLEFEKPDLAAAEAFAAVFGFATSLRTDSELHLRGTFAGSPAVIILDDRTGGAFAWITSGPVATRADAVTIEATGELADWLRSGRAAAALVRPDGTVAEVLHR